MDDFEEKKKVEKPLYELDEDGQKVYNLKEMTLLEEQYFENAKQRHLKNITKP